MFGDGGLRLGEGLRPFGEGLRPLANPLLVGLAFRFRNGLVRPVLKITQTIVSIFEKKIKTYFVLDFYCRGLDLTPCAIF